MADKDLNERAVRTYIREHRKNSAAPHLVGDCEDLLPYAWSNPMVVDEHKCSKVLREMSRAEKQRLDPPKT